MKILTKYLLLLILATCALNTDAFGMKINFDLREEQVAQEKGHALRKAIDNGNPDEAMYLIDDMRTSMNSKNFFLFINTPCFDRYAHGGDTNILNAAIEKTTGYDLRAGDTRDSTSLRQNHEVLAGKYLKIVETLITAALDRLDGEQNGEQFCKFIDARNNYKMSALFLIAIAWDFDYADPNYTIQIKIAKSLITAAEKALEKKYITPEQFCRFINAEQGCNGTALIEAAKSSISKLVSIFINSALKHLDHKEFYQFISAQTNGKHGETVLTSALKDKKGESSRFDSVQSIITAALNNLFPTEFEQFINAKNGEGQTALDVAIANEKLTQLLNKAITWNNLRLKQEKQNNLIAHLHAQSERNQNLKNSTNQHLSDFNKITPELI